MSKKIWKLLGVVLGAIYCFYYFKTTSQWHFIDNIDLIIHEAGHTVFFIFGNFLYVAGGSLMQLIIPAAFAAYFFRSKQKASATVMLMWLAINFFNVAVYAGDAVKMQLPLLGGDNSGHDWNFLLASTGLLKQTKMIAEFINFVGFISVFSAVYLGFTPVISD